MASPDKGPRRVRKLGKALYQSLILAFAASCLVLSSEKTRALGFYAKWSAKVKDLSFGTPKNVCSSFK
eukprot:244369-Rhodomonas_salina.1